MITSETDFQKWLARHLTSPGHYQDHRFSALPGVPDLSYAGEGMDYWLELKFDRFRLGHDRYDLFQFKEFKAIQSMWLHERMTAGRSICGYLGYLQTYGEDPGYTVDYLCFLTPAEYKLWEGRTVGGLLLSDFVIPAKSVLDRFKLLAFMLRAWGRCTGGRPR